MHQPETDAMKLLTLCETLKAKAEDVTSQILRRWTEIAEAEPWLALPPDVDFDHLPELIRGLSGAALCTEFHRGLCEDVARIAALHGERRSREGFNDELVYREYHLLRRGMWERMKRDHGDSAIVFLATMRLDALTSLATAAALHGLHRDEVGEKRPWARVLEQLLDEWPLPRS